MRTVYSRCQLVGQLDARENLNPSDLDKLSKFWKRHEIGADEYDALNKTYYTAHLQAMAEIQEDVEKENGIKRPKELSKVIRYKMTVNMDVQMPLKKYDWVAGKIITILEHYLCVIKEVSVWFFPCDIVLFSIEIDDSGMTFDNLVLMHGQWKNWIQSYNLFCSEGLKEVLNPLVDLTRSKDITKLTYQSTKLRQYQVIQIDDKVIKDDLLYELATHSPIGVVSDPDLCRSWKPSDDYYNEIIRENSVSAFSNWKALALNDTFTVLTLNDVYMDSECDKKKSGYHYFEMLYMRCLVQEYYCFSRNNQYRETHKMNVAAEERSIELMEKYYFYDDFSYDFLPPLMYRAIVKGLELEGDRYELTSRVKQALREERRSRNEHVISTVKIFAVVTIVATVSQMIAKISGTCDWGNRLWYNILTLTIAILLCVWLWYKTHNRTQ